MIDKDKIVSALYEAIDEINEFRPQGQRLEKALDTRLFGAGGVLDSIGLVSFIVAVEQRIAEVFGTSITLADERALSQRNSPFRSIGSLADYISKLLGEVSGVPSTHGTG